MRDFVSINKSKLMLTLYVFVFMALIAVSGTTMSTIMPQLIKSYSLKLSSVGLISVFQNLGGIAFMLFGGILADRVKKINLITAVFFANGILLCLYGFLPPFVVLLMILFVFGICASMLNLVITAYIADLYPNKRSKYVNLLHTCFGIGSFIGPIYATIMYNMGYRWNTGFVFQGALYLLIVVSFIIILLFLSGMRKSEVKPEESSKADIRYFSMLKDRNMIVICLVAFVYVGHQSTISIWLPTYLTNYVRLSTTFMGVVMASFWIGIVAGRLGYSIFSSRLDVRKFILVGSFAGTVALLTGVLSNTGFVWIASIFITGIFTGAMFPLFLVIACGWYPKKSASAASIVCVCSSLGGMLFPWLLGNIAQYSSLSKAIYISIIDLFFVFLLIWFLGMNINKKISSSAPASQN